MIESRDLLAAVIEQHNPCYAAAQGEWDMGEFDCRCGQHVFSGEWSRHLADVLLSVSEAEVVTIFAVQRAIDDFQTRDKRHWTEG